MKREDTDSLNQEVLKGLFRWSLAVVGFAAIATLAQYPATRPELSDAESCSFSYQRRWSITADRIASAIQRGLRSCQTSDRLTRR